MVLDGFGVVLDVIGPLFLKVDSQEDFKGFWQTPGAEGTRSGEGNPRFLTLLTVSSMA